MKIGYIFTTFPSPSETFAVREIRNLQKPVFDMLDELKPDLFLCLSEDFNNPILGDALGEYNVDTVVFGLGYPADKITPRLLCIDDQVSDTILENVTVPYYKLKSAANIAQFNNGVIDTKYDSDILYISNCTLRTGILNILTELSNSDLKLKICGNQPVPLPEYIGYADCVNISNLLASATIALDFDGNIRMNAASNKTMCISNIDNTIFPSFDDNDIKDVIEHYLTDSKHRKHQINLAYKFAKENTYYHRLIDISMLLNWCDILNESQRKIEELVK